MEALVLMAVLVFGVAIAGMQIVGLQLATDLMQPEEPMSFGTAALVWLLGGIATLGASCGLSLCTMFVPLIGLLIPPVVTVAVYSYVLSAFSKLELTSAFLAVLLWTGAQALLATALWAAIATVSALTT
jgi:hypothetical protein